MPVSGSNAIALTLLLATLCPTRFRRAISQFAMPQALADPPLPPSPQPPRINFMRGFLGDRG